MSAAVRVHALHSTALAPAERAGLGLVVHEIVDSALLGEGVLPALRDAYARLLSDDAESVPAGATLAASAPVKFQSTLGTESGQLRCVFCA